jgi:hypothetical protein
MKTTNRYLAAMMALLVVAGVLFLTFNLAGPAFSKGALSSLIAPPQQGEVIPLESLSGLTSLNATLALNVNGLIDGERVQGDLSGVVLSNDQDMSKITVSGPLLGDLAAQVGGSLVGLFTPKQVDLYKTPDGAYIVIGGLVPICVKPKAINAATTLDDLSPQTLFTMLTSSDVARGTLVGEETRNGRRVKHYVIDGDAFLAAAQKSTDKQLRKFADALWSADDADLFVDVETGLPVAFSGAYSGSYEPLKLQGDFGIDLELTGINTNPTVKLPAACNKPIVQ